MRFRWPSFLRLVRSAPEPAIVIEPPSRLFHVPVSVDLHAIFTTLLRLGYEMTEQNLEERRFFSVLTHGSFHVRVRVEAQRLDRCWEVRFFCDVETVVEDPLSPASLLPGRNLYLLLAQITEAMGWKKYWVIEAEQPLAA
jgi:hypothetical protein